MILRKKTTEPSWLIPTQQTSMKNLAHGNKPEGYRSKVRRIIKIQLSQLAGWNDWSIVKFTELCCFFQEGMVLDYRGSEAVFCGIFVDGGKYYTNAWFGTEDVFPRK